MTETFYDVLGVSEDATTEEIQSAYRDRLKEVHPDVSDDEDAGETTQRLVEARDVLVDEDERARYDRVGHRNYVDGVDAAAAAEGTTRNDGEPERSEETASGSAEPNGGEARDRGRRERRARQRVREERATGRSSTASSADVGADTTSTGQSSTGTSSADTTSTGRSSADVSSSGNRQGGYGPNGATVDDDVYSVRTEVERSRSIGPILPSGRRLTLLGIFFALYPVLLFSALLPAFPLFVNLTIGACTLMMIGYLQSMPRIALLVFGGWSGITVTLLLLLGIDFFSLFGIAVLSGTVLPFAFSVLIAWALWY